MTNLKGACIIGQSGGPTSVINASAYGAIKTALEAECITKVYGAVNGIKGVLDEVFYDLNEEDAKELELLLYTPSSVLGSCRYKLSDPDVDDTDYKRILEVFKKYDIRYFFYNGGNDSMDTCNKISKFMVKSGWECRIMGIPKTIDNDLYGTDYCPGFPSAAKFVATTCMEIYQDARVYDTEMICVIEVMGRNAGWLTASAALATHFGNGPDLIYLPEVTFSLDKLVSDVKTVFDKTKKCIIVVSEGIKDETGHLIADVSDKPLDSFGHKQLGGLAPYLASYIQEKLNVSKVRGIEFSLMQRCASHIASQTDIEQSFLAGESAVLNAINGKTDFMIGFERSYDEKGNYINNLKLLPLSEVANTEKTIPLNWINAEKNGLTQEFIDYALPLIQGETKLPRENGLPRYAKMKKVIVK